MRPLLARWDELPEELHTSEVRPYWEALDARYAQLAAKRAMDVAGSAALLAVLSPAMLATTLAVRFDSPGPVMYRQERVTQYGRRFRIHKFRTMVDGADRIGARVTSGGDARVTRVGQVLRRYRLDELPQLIDIIRGDMTFVGTRPEVPEYVEAYDPEWRATLLLPAGVTSACSVAFRDEAELLEGAADPAQAYISEVLPYKMRLNLDALRSFSLTREAGVVLDTVAKVFVRSQATTQVRPAEATA